MSIRREGKEGLVEYMVKDGYFDIPASTKYHSNFWASEDGECGGLAYHSYLVKEILEEKNSQYNLGLSKDSIHLMAYLHDLAKIGLYGTKYKNGYLEKYSYKIKKDPLTDKWISEKSVELNTETSILHFGHGELSCIRIMQFLKKVTPEELLAIRWHSGAYEAKEHYRDFHEATKKHKSVMALHLADLEASQIIEEVIEPEICDVKEYNEYMKRKAENKKCKEYE